MADKDPSISLDVCTGLVLLVLLACLCCRAVLSHPQQVQIQEARNRICCCEGELMTLKLLSFGHGMVVIVLRVCYCNANPTQCDRGNWLCRPQTVSSVRDMALYMGHMRMTSDGIIGVKRRQHRGVGLEGRSFSEAAQPAKTEVATAPPSCVPFRICSSRFTAAVQTVQRLNGCFMCATLVPCG